METKKGGGPHWIVLFDALVVSVAENSVVALSAGLQPVAMISLYI